MNFFSFVALMVATNVSSTVIELNTHHQGFLFIWYRFVGNVPEGPFTAMLMHHLYEPIPVRSRLYGRGLVIRTTDDQEITTPSLLNIMSNTDNVLCIGAGFDSVFATDFARTYMMIPSNHQLIINPENPRDFVYNGVLTTITSTSWRYPQVGVSVSLLNTTRAAPDGDIIPSAIIQSTAARSHPFVFVTAQPEDCVPESIIRALEDELAHRGYATNRTVSGIDILGGDLTDEAIDTFPIIQYRIRGDSGEDILIQLVGRDYVGPLNGDSREVRLRSGDTLNAFGLNTLSKVALFIDNRNRTIGFGDPL